MFKQEQSKVDIKEVSERVWSSQHRAGWEEHPSQRRAWYVMSEPAPGKKNNHVGCDLVLGFRSQAGYKGCPHVAEIENWLHGRQCVYT